LDHETFVDENANIDTVFDESVFDENNRNLVE
jgi:hypothetical protein